MMTEPDEVVKCSAQGFYRSALITRQVRRETWGEVASHYHLTNISGMEDQMVQDSVRKLFTDQPLVALATTSADGTPNVAPMFWKLWHDDSTLLVLDNFMNETKANIQATSKACLSAWNAEPGEAYKIKGSAEYLTDGIYMVKGSEFMASQRPGEQPRGVIVIHVKEVYNQKPGEGAGNLIERIDK